MRQSTKTTFIVTRGFRAFLPCRAAVVPQDPQLCVRDHPPPPGPRSGRAGGSWIPGSKRSWFSLPAERRDIRRARGRVRVGTTTAWRYVEETVALLAARAPRLRQAVRGAKKAGYAHVVLDGILIPIDRVAADRPFYSGKHKKHGMNLQVIASPGGDVRWVSGALPGSVPDKKAEWIWASWTNWRPPVWSRSPTTVTREARTRRCRRSAGFPHPRSLNLPQ